MTTRAAILHVASPGGAQTVDIATGIIYRTVTFKGTVLAIKVGVTSCKVSKKRLVRNYNATNRGKRVYCGGANLRVWQ